MARRKQTGRMLPFRGSDPAYRRYLPTISVRNNRNKRKRKEGTLTKSRRAGLQMPVNRVRKSIKERRYTPRLGSNAPIYLSAVLEYCGYVDMYFYVF